MMMMMMMMKRMPAKAFFLASAFTSLLQLKQAIEDGSSLLYVDQFGKTALHYAAQCGHESIVAYIIERGQWRFCLLLF